MLSFLIVAPAEIFHVNQGPQRGFIRGGPLRVSQAPFSESRRSLESFSLKINRKLQLLIGFRKFLNILEKSTYIFGGLDC